MMKSFGKLNNYQLDRLSEFTANLGLVFFAALVLPIFSGIDKVNYFNVVWGLALTTLCLIVSLFVLRRNRK